MALWGTSDASTNVPHFSQALVPNAANNSSLYGNTTVNNTVPTAVVGVFGVDAAEAVAARGDAKGSVAPGWVLRTQGTGGVTAITVTANGSGYTNGDVVTVANGYTNATGIIVTNAAGNVVSVGVSVPGSGWVNGSVANTSVTVGGSGATFSISVGGRAGRVTHETLVAMKSAPTTDGSDDTLFPDS